MNITHVLRAEEHLPNTLRQVGSYSARAGQDTFLQRVRPIVQKQNHILGIADQNQGPVKQCLHRHPDLR